MENLGEEVGLCSSLRKAQLKESELKRTDLRPPPCLIVSGWSLSRGNVTTGCHWLTECIFFENTFRSFSAVSAWNKPWPCVSIFPTKPSWRGGGVARIPTGSSPGLLDNDCLRKSTKSNKYYVFVQTITNILISIVREITVYLIMEGFVPRSSIKPALVLWLMSLPVCLYLFIATDFTQMAKVVFKKYNISFLNQFFQLDCAASRDAPGSH